MSVRERTSGLNVILVIFDSLRKDMINSYGLVPQWGGSFRRVPTPRLDEFAAEGVRFTRAYPESLPTLPARRALYTGRRTYPFHGGRFRLKGDFRPSAGWGPIPEEQHTLSEILSAAGFRTALVSDVYHEFKPSKNFWRGFDQWSFIRGQEADPSRSGPVPSKEEMDYWVPEELRGSREVSFRSYGRIRTEESTRAFTSRILLNRQRLVKEEDWPNARVMQTAVEWLEQNADARERGERVFLTVECFDPHEPWFVPAHYRRLYDPGDGREQVISPYEDVSQLPEALLRRSRANYAGLVTMVDRWFGFFVDALRYQGWLSDTVVIVTSDHGHSLGERGYMGKRGYPSEPEVIDVPLIVRHPEGIGAGEVCEAIVQHHDIAASVLDAAGVVAPEAIDGMSFWGGVFGGGELRGVGARVRGWRGARECAVIGWGPAVTVVKEPWWLNCKVDGQGAVLFRKVDLEKYGVPENVAEAEREVSEELFNAALAEAQGGFPTFLLEEAQSTEDAPGCSPIAGQADVT